MVWSGSFVQWHINLRRLFNAKAILQEQQCWCYLNHRWADEEIHTFSKGISSKVKVIAPLEFELAYYAVRVRYVSHYIYIYILSCAESTKSLAILLYRPLLLADSLDYTRFPHRAVSKTLLAIQPWCVHVKESTRGRLSCVHSYFLSSTQRILLVFLEYFVRWEVRQVALQLLFCVVLFPVCVYAHTHIYIYRVELSSEWSNCVAISVYARLFIWIELSVAVKRIYVNNNNCDS